MGIHLCIVTPKPYTDNPEWDCGRMSGDRAFVDLMAKLPSDYSGDESEYVRPSSFPAWREAIKAIDHFNPGRWTKLLDILERDKTQWIYVSW